MNPFAKYKAIAIGIAILAAAIGLLWTGHHYGAQGVQAKWDRERLQAEIQAENNRLLAQSRINKIDNAGAAKAKKQAAIDQSIIAKVPEYAPSSLPLLPGSVRVLHDAAATGQKIDDSSTAHASSVAVKDLAATTIANYSAARSDQAALEELQAIVRASGCFDIEE
jgi:hypothetical protein